MACQLLAALELGRRLVSASPEERNIVSTPQDAVNLLAAEMGYLEQEHLRMVLLSSKSEVRGIHEVYIGNVNASIIRVSEELRPAIRENCPSIIVVHNHPSRDPAPSAEMPGVELLDHIIIGGQGFISLKDKGLGFGDAADRNSR
jgi:DNA repair protein RadC